MANTTITPNTGTLSMTLALATPLIVAAGALGLVGGTPLLQFGRTITPQTGQLSMTVQASPVLGANTGVLGFIGQQPVVNRTGIGPNIVPGTGTLVMTAAPSPYLIPLTGSLGINGNAPGVLSPMLITPGTGVLGLAGSVSPQTLTLPPLITGALSFVGNPPVVFQSVSPGSAVLSLVGNAPLVTTITVINIPVGAISIQGNPPGVLVKSGITPGAGSVALNGNQPGITVSLSAIPGTGSLSMAGNGVVINAARFEQPNTGTVGFVGNAPVVAQTLNVLVKPGTGGLGFVGQQPTQFTPQTIITGTGSMSMAGLAPVTLNNTQVPTGIAQFLGTVPLIGMGYAIPSGSLSFSGAAPVVAQTFAFNITPGTGALGFSSDPQQVIQRLQNGLFAGINLVSTYPNIWPYNTRPEPYGEFYLSVGDVEPFGIDFSGMLASRWTMGAAVVAGEVIRPVVPNGYQYICTQAGASAAVEPLFPPYNGGQVLDGSVIWQAEGQDETSLQGILQTTIWTASSGLALSGSVLLSGSATSDQTAIIFVDTTNAISGQDYIVKCTAFIQGTPEKIVGTIKVKVR